MPNSNRIQRVKKKILLPQFLLSGYLIVRRIVARVRRWQGGETAQLHCHQEPGRAVFLEALPEPDRCLQTFVGLSTGGVRERTEAAEGVSP